jgi:purine-binding chemotaxis protein CheW
MKKINILEFSIGNNLFGLKTEHIKTIFEIENVKDLPLAPDYIYGVTNHNKQIYPLVCFEKLLELEDNCKDVIGRTAIVVNIDNKHYALVVDEIHKIQEIEKTENSDDVINFYNLQGTVLEEITPSFLKRRINMPPLKQDISHESFENTTARKEDESSILIFRIGEKILGIPTDVVKKVEHTEDLEKTHIKEKSWINGIYLIRDIPVKAGNIAKLLDIKQQKIEYLIILEEEGKYFGFEAEEIMDLITVKTTSIKKGNSINNFINDFVLHNNKIIPIISKNFIKESFQNHGLKANVKDKESNETKEEIDILVFKLGDDLFGIKMENLHEVLDFDDVYISNYPTEIDEIEGLIATGKESLFLITFEKYLKKKINPQKILIIKEENLKIALSVTDIEDILSVPKNNFAEFETNQLFVKGVVIDKKNNLINVLNPAWILYKYKKEYSG